PNDIARQLQSWSDSNKPLRLIITETPWNLLVFISSFEPIHSGGHGDIKYSLSLTERRPIIVQEVGQTKAQSTKRPNTKPQPKTYVVKSGDSLWVIAKRIYGNGNQWRKIWEANRDKIKNPDIIYPGQKLTIPA